MSICENHLNFETKSDKLQPIANNMPKHGFLTPKAIANRIKAKGLQKLKWYCQMCEKQCRDENGFKVCSDALHWCKDLWNLYLLLCLSTVRSYVHSIFVFRIQCHKLSESHQRKMKLFIAAPQKFMGQFSKEFDHGFMQILRLKGGRRVKANEVYQDYIANRQHIHMNATVWSTLSGYVMYLGKTGKAKVERAGENEGNGRGWYVTYIDRDPEVISKQEQVKKLKKMEERERRMESQRIQRIIEQNQRMNKIKGNEYEVSGLQKQSDSEKITFGFKPKCKSNDDPEADAVDDEDHHKNGNVANDQESSYRVDDVPEIEDDRKQRSNGTDRVETDNINDPDRNSKNNRNERNDRKRKRTNLEALIEENEHKKQENKRRRLNEETASSINTKNSWLMNGIIVKVKEGHYVGKKGVVLNVVEKRGKYRAVLRLLKMRDVEIEVKEKYL